MNNAYLELLKRRPQFRLLWLAQVVSLTGDWFNTIALIILVNRFTDSGLAISLLFLARGLPPFLFGPIVGVVADRFDRRLVLVASDIAQTITALGFLLISSSGELWLLYVLTTLQATLASFFEPARAAILPGLVDRGQELLLANTLSSATWSVMLAFGAAVGGVATAVFGVRIALVINAMTFAASAALLSRIRPARIPPPTDSGKQSGWLDFLDGVRYILQRPRVGVFASVKGLSQVGSVDTLFSLYAASVFVVGNEGAITLGVLFMSFGLGAIIGPVLGNMAGDGSDRFLRRWIWIGFFLLAAGWIGFGVAPWLFAAALAIMVRGMGSSINWTYSNVWIQKKVPDQFLGRVFALDFSFFTLCYTMAVIATGVLIDAAQLGPRVVAVIFGGAGMLPFAAWVVVLRSQASVEPQEGEARTLHEAPVLSGE
ncbi:MAG: MFS transporter [Chloroflexi bacterium]|nr:MFS transporter [Chloroflexota bacterium]